MGRGDLQLQDLRVLLMLMRARGPLTTKAISDHVGVPMRTVQRIIQAFEQVPLPIRRDSVGMGGGIRLLADLGLKVALPSDLVEMASLLVAREHMRDAIQGTPLGEAFEELSERTLAAMSHDQRAIANRFARMYRTKRTTRSASRSPIGTMVQKALDEGRVLVIEYTSPGELRAKRREIEPIAVWVAKDRTYVLARDRSKNALRTFATDRIRGATLSELRYSAPDAIDPDRYFEHALSAFVGEGPQSLELLLDPEAVRRLGGRLPASTARLVPRPDGGAKLHWDVPLSDELLSWMVTLGAGVKVVAPKAAIDFVREAFTARAATQAKPTRAKRPTKPKRKPTALPGPLVRKMIGR